MPDQTAPAAVATLRFNERTLACPPGWTLAALLAEQGLAAEAVATAVNGQFVPRALRQATPLQAGDSVLTFHAIVGG